MTFTYFATIIIPATISLLCLITSIGYIVQKNIPNAGLWFSYFLANLFFTWISIKGLK